MQNSPVENSHNNKQPRQIINPDCYADLFPSTEVDLSVLSQGAIEAGVYSTDRRWSHLDTRPSQPHVAQFFK